MALRVVLVGLVVGLGVDLPSGEEVSGWVRAGGAWVRARIDGLAGPEVVAEVRPTADAEFAAVVDEMATAFAADLSASGRPAPRRQPAFERFEVPDDLEAGVAFALNRSSQGEGLTPDAAPAEVATPRSVGPEPAALARSARLMSAVRLTGQAAAAWWTVIRGAESAAIVR